MIARTEKKKKVFQLTWSSDTSENVRFREWSALKPTNFDAISMQNTIVVNFINGNKHLSIYILNKIKTIDRSNYHHIDIPMSKDDTDSNDITSKNETSKSHVRIYTRRGDKGMSSLYNREKRLKNDPVFEALGDADELNAAIGIAVHYCTESKNGLTDKLANIQSRLLDIGSAIATPLTSKKTKTEQIEIAAFKKGKEYIIEMERWIDEMESKLPPLTNFILPSGGLASSHLHLARAIARRFERHLVTLKTTGDLDETACAYVNR
ncbi:hypothetical protein RFI_35444 [Reticulomyxa filosa]|uniref:Cobalamin adenosyltransferase-like domain-containing protein n=1 Tax=Reticulomyxa filosa TaxID=46433 RepID=X6LLI7_RETFI|nr:hypothetical protein RFI_35444 [Reticulomyxa filosa]|eukprot:ETO01997.1 hypothetical protein RFI_35444 [Reticulomyxa filosa]